MNQKPSLDFELVVIGTGPAGSSVARKLAEAGRRVAIVEARAFGGTCALRGCNPKKVFTNAGELVDRLQRGDGRLIAAAAGQIDWRVLQAFKREFTEPVAEKSERSFQDDGIETFHGTARFTGEETIDVAGQTLRSERFLIASGSHPRPLEFPGSDLVTHSDEFLERETMPRRLLFIGGGYISMEFAHVAARARCEVTIVERNDQLLSGFDPDLVDLLSRRSKEIGICGITNCDVQQIQRSADNTLLVSLSNGQQVTADLVIHGAGRVPNIANMSLDQGDIQFNDDGIAVDATMRSCSNRRVFAAGDCAASGKLRLTPVANEEARMIAKNLFSEEPGKAPDYGIVPSVAFTTPAIAAIGLSERQARERKESPSIDVRYDETSSWGSVRKLGPTVSGYKVIIDIQSDKILGAHLLGPAAEETINLFALAMKFDLTATDMKSTLFAFPTFASDVRQML